LSSNAWSLWNSLDNWTGGPISISADDVMSVISGATW